LDVFASLNLNDDSDDDDIAEEDAPNAAPSAVGPYVSMLKASVASADNPLNDTDIHDDGVEDVPSGSVPSDVAPGKRKRRKKGKKKSNYNKPSKWADQCMYAELLEMTADDNLWESDHDTLPRDLETSWVAVAPIPVGKRCLVVTHQSPGLGGGSSV
jgi:snurportin-1